MDKQLVLQSGFTTPAIDGFVLPAESSQTLAEVIIKPYLHESNKYHYSKAIQELLDQYNFNSTIVKDFEFRENFIKAFMNIMTGISFKQWVYQLQNSPRITNSGVEFLLDTLRFIATGQRNTAIENWVGLVHYSHSSKVQANLLNTLQCWFGDRKDSNSSDYHTLPFTVTAILSLWLSHPEGFKDFILSCGIIFGKQPHIDLAIR